MGDIIKHGVTVMLSHDLTLPKLFNSNPEANRARNAELKRQRELDKSNWEARWANDDTPLGVIARLHTPEGDGWLFTCGGCDWGGYEGDAPDWPCRTAELLMDEEDV